MTLTPANWPSFRYAPAAGSRGILSSRWRDDARQRVQTPRQVSGASRLRCHAGMLPGQSHNTHCPFGRSSHLYSLRADNSPCRDPSARNKRSDNVALCAIPRLHCHDDCTAVPSGRATARVAAISAPACRHPSRQRRRSAVLEVWSGRLSPEAPTHPLRFRPFHPQGSALGHDWFEGWPYVAADSQAFRVCL